jgi:hypothetical protein
MATRSERVRPEGSAQHPHRTLHYRFRKSYPWLAGLLLLAGVIAAIVRFAPSSNPPKQANDPVSPAIAPKPTPKPKTVPLSKGAVSVARRFVTTAVARKDLPGAWKIVSPNVKGGLTYKEWLSGNIPVVPFPVDARTVARFKIDWSYPRETGLEVVLVAKSPKVKPQDFFILLKKVGAGSTQRWIVDSWVPHSTPLVPVGTQ